MKTKSEAPEKIASYLRPVENQLGRRVKSLRSDNGTELKNTKTKEMMDKLGILHTFMNVHTPEQNGRIEREMRTIIEAARAAIHADELDERLWAEAMNHAIFTINHTGTSNVPGKSPGELWFGRKMKIEKLRPFGCECYVLTHAQNRGKIDSKSEKGILVGYDIDSPCYRMQEEYDSLMEMKTWTLVDCPEGVKPITCRWVLREKADGRLKARLVARGFEQKGGVDYAETFSPVARHASIRLLLSHAASEKMKLVSFDVKTAFLYRNLEQVIYMKQPEGFDDGSGKVCKLDKTLYGLKQAPSMWNERVTTHFEKKIGLINTDDDPCIYYNKDKSIMLFVDDGLIAGKNEDEIYRILGEINKEFQITISKKAQDKLTYLGMEIKIDQDGIFANQPRYTEKILRKMKLE
ncbi:unnamed protein product [Parnassius mnemosyne]|uniref:Integrase catalytic domain-containing protein n=1 Tax=Parnassius mnemosyne TaxID=213953 RepID=A0AAV1KSZ7_9NEOP